MTQRILIVSDENSAAPLRRVLERSGFDVSFTGDVETASSLIGESSCDLIIVDFVEPRLGVELIRRIRSEPHSRRVPVLTIAEWGTGQATIMLSAGADAFEPKPIMATRLMGAVQRLLGGNLARSAAAQGSGNGDDD